MDEAGEESFTASQIRCSTHFPDPYLRQKYPVKMEVFDILQADNTNLTTTPYLKRKEILHELLADEDDVLQESTIEYDVLQESTIEYVPFEEDLVKAWKEAITKNREGLIVKQKESPYEHDRSYNWLKVKNWRFEKCNVVGYTPGTGARSSFFGSLVLERNGQYRGCAGSGFNEWELRKFKNLFTDAPRIPQPYNTGEPYTAVKVDAQVLVKYYQITDAKVMRFPIFILS